MTTVGREEKVCGVCGERSEQMVVYSTSTAGAYLDLRPRTLGMPTEPFGIERCPHCGYTAPDISTAIEASVASILNSTAYVEQSNDSTYPGSANKHLCWSIIQETLAAYNEAGLATLSAAWICDDAGNSSASERCRQRAVELLERAREHDQAYAHDVGTEDCILVDVLRRSNQFAKALFAVNEALAKHPDSNLQRVLQFQLELIGKQDNTAHLVQEAFSKNG